MPPSLFSSAISEKYYKETRKDRFLKEIDRLIPWGDFTDSLRPYCTQLQGAGRDAIDVERMLRIRLLQHWYGFSDLDMEEALLDFPIFAQFAGIDLEKDPLPDEAAIREFRSLLEKRNLEEELLRLVEEILREHGVKVLAGKYVSPSFTRNPGAAQSGE